MQTRLVQVKLAKRFCRGSMQQRAIDRTRCHEDDLCRHTVMTSIPGIVERIAIDSIVAARDGSGLAHLLALEVRRIHEEHVAQRLRKRQGGIARSGGLGGCAGRKES
jgi:hypothetical protein